MNLEHQVTNKDLSKRLKELGVKQDSYWNYASATNAYGSTSTEMILVGCHGLSKDTKIEHYSAFGVSELFDIIPSELMKSQLNFSYNWKGKNFTFVFQNKMSECSKTLVDALAKMIIFLIKLEYIKVGDLK